MSNQAKKRTLDRAVVTVALVGSLALANVIAARVFGRLDLTADRQFTLSDATKSVLDDLKGPVTVRAYFSSDLPPQAAAVSRYVRDLLDEYYAHGHGNFRYEFVDPLAEETAEDKEKKKEVTRDAFGRPVREATSVERELQSFGIQPFEIQANQDDKVELKRVYMAIAIVYSGGDSEKKDALPQVIETNGLEYELTTRIRKMTRVKVPKVALIGGHDSLSTETDLKAMWSLLPRLYDVTTINLGELASTSSDAAAPGGAKIPDDVDAILVVGPRTPFTDAEKRILDAFVMSGRGAAFLLDSVDVELSQGQVNDVDHGLGDLLASYGVQLQPGLVLDAECGTVGVRQPNFPFPLQMKYPYFPLRKALDREHPLTRGLANVVMPFTSPVSVAFADSDGVKGDVIVQSSPKSWVQEPPYDLNPSQRWPAELIKDGNKGMVVTVTGALKSYAGDARATNGRVLVAGGASLVTDDAFNQSRGNVALVFNLMDWLVLDEALLGMRARGLQAAPIAEVSDGSRATVKYGNIVGLPLAFVALGLVRWRLREKRRGAVKA